MSFSCEPSYPRRGIRVLLGRHVGEKSASEGLVFAAMQSGGWYGGRGAVFPAESCMVQTEQTQIPAKPRMVCLE